MPGDIGDYALIGDLHTAALVGRDGSLDWFCAPRFDSPSMFAAILGDEEQGRWRIAPAGAGPEEPATSRRYEGEDFVLSTRWIVDDETSGSGEVEVLDLMPRGAHRAVVIRRIRGVRGRVRMTQSLRIRFDYAGAVPWMRQMPEHAGSGEHALLAVAGPDAALIRGPRFRALDHEHRAELEVAEGEVVDTVLGWHRSWDAPPPPVDVDAAIEATRAWWSDWIASCDAPAVHPEAVRRSLLVLRALTLEETGGVVAAATTSLPEEDGGERNWDYRFVWLRDASLTLEALMLHGYAEEASEWRAWLLRAIAGDPADLQIMYGVGGERRLPEEVLAHLPGHRGAAPVRIGNQAAEQFQGDIFGEVMLALERARRIGVAEDRFSWSLQVALLEYLETVLDRPDHGIWEIRGPERWFTHSRVMIWAAFDCGVRAIEELGLRGPLERWRDVRARLREEIETRGVDPATGAFRQHYDADEVDAALLAIPQTGFVEAGDERMRRTVERIESELMRDGLVRRYRTESGVDGLEGDEHPFLACSFWLVRQYAESDRVGDASALLDRLVASANDVGLLAEELDPATGRAMGNTPQALSHLALVKAADAVSAAIARRDDGGRA
ncbi:glycoside hydrolase family 15 protein [Homoserinibacter sp. YIM 151385]|uniref:glycoside hydrolase family 15 protein n=1 Tax=Homoserinibacter sp. YIM 151385 TaxID=2985506 RepID=UPI0022F08F0E|nr:glycoside hydrolase family 15 protein [Homoserinibacter sp. YIM 151385]WBU38771.1 glycoside hydrolase family 15 protein [Homoserinibacter sp. YIM 151385]